MDKLSQGFSHILYRPNLSLKSLSIFTQQNFFAYSFAIGVVSVCTLIGFTFFNYVDNSNLIMIYLLGVVVVATTEQKRGPSIAAALISTFTFDFFFIPPFFSFSVSDIQYFCTLIIMLVVTQIISHLTIRVQRHSEAIQKAKAQAEVERLRNILLTSISHDLRTPLTAIMGSSSSLLQAGDELSKNTRVELLNNIYDESKRLSRLVNNVLQIIRLEAGSIKISKHMSSLKDILNNVLEGLEMPIKDKSLRVTIDFPQKLPTLLLDPLLIEQVIMNILENAVKHAPSSSYIKISAKTDAKEILIKIADRGPGINADEVNNIFDKFYQSKKSPRNDAGFGLGLAICKNIIKAHHGKIWAENRNEGGAVFCISLPLDTTCT